MMLGDEMTRVENLFKSCVNAPPEIVFKWNEKFFEEKWLLTHLTRDEIREE